MHASSLTETAISAAVLRSAADAIVVSDRDGVIRFWNPGAERIFGFPAAEANGRSLDIIIPERLRTRHWDGYRETMRTGKSRYSAGELLSVPALRRDGSQISVEFTITPMPDADGAIIGLLAVMRDATIRFQELKALRQQLRARDRTAPVS